MCLPRTNDTRAQPSHRTTWLRCRDGVLGHLHADVPGRRGHRSPIRVFQHFAGLVREALARALVREREDVSADRDVVVFVENPVGAAADHLRGPRVAELLNERWQQLREAPLVRGRVGFELLDSVLDKVVDAAWMMSRISRTSSSGLPAGSGMSQSSTRVGT